MNDTRIPLHNTIIYLIGFPGTGKYTIALELANRTTIRIVDNQLINNPIFSVIGADGKTRLPNIVWDKVGVIREAVLDSICTLSPPDFSFVFTNVLCEDEPDDHKGYRRIEETAAVRSANFIPVRLLCEAEELARRVVTPSRRDRLKDICAESARRNVTEREVLHVNHPRVMTLDVTALSAAEAAERILREAMK